MADVTVRATPDELLRLPDQGMGFELVDGELKELDVSNESSQIGGEILFLLKAFVRPGQLGYVFMADNAFQCFPDPETVRRADVSFITADRLSPQEYRTPGHCRVCPDLVVEVVSPNDRMAEVIAKRKEWLAAGARLVWVVDPLDQTVHAYTPGGPARLLQPGDVLTGEPVLPGFSVAVAELFRPPVTPVG